MTSYAIEFIAGCFLLKAIGPNDTVPMDAMVQLKKLISKKAILDTNMARIHGAILVTGTPSALEKLRQDEITIGRRLAYRANLSQRYPNDIKDWLTEGEVGSSSMAMVHRLFPTEASTKKHTAIPSDTSDLRRCLLLEEQCLSVQARLKTVADISPAWARLIAAWEDLKHAMNADDANWRLPIRTSPPMKPLPRSTAYDMLKRLTNEQTGGEP